MGGIQWGRGIVGKGGWVSSPCGSGVEDWDFFSFRLGGVSGFFLTPGTFHFKAVSPWIFLINFFSAGEGGRVYVPGVVVGKRSLWIFTFGFSSLDFLSLLLGGEVVMGIFLTRPE